VVEAVFTQVAFDVRDDLAVFIARIAFLHAYENDFLAPVRLVFGFDTSLGIVPILQRPPFVTCAS